MRDEIFESTLDSLLKMGMAKLSRHLQESHDIRGLEIFEKQFE